MSPFLAERTHTGPLPINPTLYLAWIRFLAIQGGAQKRQICLYRVTNQDYRCGIDTEVSIGMNRPKSPIKYCNKQFTVYSSGNMSYIENHSDLIFPVRD